MINTAGCPFKLVSFGQRRRKQIIFTSKRPKEEKQIIFTRKILQETEKDRKKMFKVIECIGGPTAGSVF